MAVANSEEIFLQQIPWTDQFFSEMEKYGDRFEEARKYWLQTIKVLLPNRTSIGTGKYLAKMVIKRIRCHILRRMNSKKICLIYLSTLSEYLTTLGGQRWGAGSETRTVPYTVGDSSTITMRLRWDDDERGDTKIRFQRIYQNATIGSAQGSIGRPSFWIYL